MSHNVKVGLYVIGALVWLRDHGLINGTIPDVVTPKGVGEFDQLERSGFRPTKDEVRGFLGALKKTCNVQSTTLEDDTMVLLISELDRVKAMA